MSWSVSGTIGPDKEVNYRNEVLQQENGEKESKKALDSAKKIAEDIIASGIVGDPKGEFAVQLNGHSNDKNRAKSGHSNDYIAITITQKERP